MPGSSGEGGRARPGPGPPGVRAAPAYSGAVSSPSSIRSRALLAAGSSRLRLEVRDGRDRLVASDPGLARLGQAVRAVVGVATTIAVEAALVAVTGTPTTVGLLALMLGAVIAMTMSTSIREESRRVIVGTATGAGVAAATGAAIGVVTAQVHAVGLIAFAVVSFVAVWVRRFGPRWVTVGFLLWQAFFFSLFLDPPVSTLPLMLTAIGVGTLWVGLLLLTVLHGDPQVRLSRTVTALRARARAGVAAALEVIDDPDDVGAVRAVRGQLVQLAEISLLLDGQLGTSRALPPWMSAGAVRRWVVDLEIGMDELCAAALELSSRRDEVPATVLDEVRTVLRALGWGDAETARAAAQRLTTTDHGGNGPARRVGAAAGFIVETVRQWDSPPAWASTSTGRAAHGAVAEPLDLLDEPDEPDGSEGVEAFEAVVTLTGGNLPGSAALAARAVTRADAPRWSPTRLRLTTRQAIQAGVAAALAIVVGEAISPQRYYWAVIAAFIAFTGTATAGETIRKGVARVVGTFGGLVAAVGLATLTSGQPVAAVLTLLGCIFLAFYVQELSYTAMIFFITVMLGELYTLLHTFSDQVLLIRLEETAAGALIGVGVSLLVLPAGTRATLRIARRTFLASLADLLDACADRLDRAAAHRDLLTLVVQMGADARQVVRGHRAMTKGRLFGADREGLRHRISVLGALDATARALAAAVDALGGRTLPELAGAVRAVATEARRLEAVTSLAGPHRDPDDDTDLSQRVSEHLDRVPNDPSTERVCALVRRLTDMLVLLTPRGG